MASRLYCSDVALELKCLSEKLHKLSSGIDHIPSIDKFKLSPQIQDLHIIMTELDDRICSLMCACDTVESPYPYAKEGTDLSLTKSDKLDKSKNVFFDYDFGG